MTHTSYDALSAIQQKLLNEAEKAYKNSYSPYSNFSVGAALLTFDDTIITGTNFENASYSVTICAERSAITRANSLGHRKFKAIAITGSGKNKPTKDVISPCGICRQMLLEVSHIANYNIEVIMSSTHRDKIIISTIEELLPLAFGPANL